MDSQKKKSKKVLWIVLLAILVLLLAAGGAAAYLLHGLHGETIPIVRREEAYTIPTVKEEAVSHLTPEELETMSAEDVFLSAETAEVQPTEDVPIWKREKAAPDITNILLLGRDGQGASEYGTMFLISYNGSTHKAGMISFMRDMLVPIEGHDWGRIDTVFSFGGIGSCINTLNAVFSLDIQNYMIIDLEGLVTVADSVGGVDIRLTANEAAFYQAAGILENVPDDRVVHMDGITALLHMQGTPSDTDEEKLRRQSDVLGVLLDKLTSSASVSDVTNLVNTILDVVDTNLSAVQLLTLVKNVMTDKDAVSMQSVRLPYEGTFTPAWYKKALVSEFDIEENTKRLHELLYGES